MGFLTRLLCLWDFSGKNTEVGCHFLLQEICLTQESNLCLLCLLHCKHILYHWATGEALYSATTAAAAAAKLLQSCPTLCDPTDGSPPGLPVPGILQARTLEWFAISFSNAWKWKVKVKSLSRVQLLATPWTAAHQALPPMDFPGKSTGVAQSLSCVWLFATPWTTARQASLSLTISQKCSNSCPLSQWCHPGVGGVCSFFGSVLPQLKFEVANKCYSSVTAQFYLASKEKYILEAWGWANPKKKKKKRAEKTEAQSWLLFLYVFLLPLSLPSINWAR